jgi:hypothetical protein
MINFFHKVEGQYRLVAAIEGLRREWVDLRRCEDALRDAYIDQEVEIFSSEGAASGHPWDPLSKGYAARKQKIKPGAGIEYLEGTLEISLTTRGGLSVVQVPEQYRVGWGTGVRYARAQHYGRPEINLPARKLIALTPSSPVRYRDIVRNDAEAYAVAQGFRSY